MGDNKHSNIERSGESRHTHTHLKQARDKKWGKEEINWHMGDHRTQCSATLLSYRSAKSQSMLWNPRPSCTLSHAPLAVVVLTIALAVPSRSILSYKSSDKTGRLPHPSHFIHLPAQWYLCKGAVWFPSVQLHLIDNWRQRGSWRQHSSALLLFPNRH